MKLPSGLGAYSRLVPIGALVAAMVAAGCGAIVAPPPPSRAAESQRDTIVPGVPISVAARAARVMQTFGYTTRRFGPDSTWAWRTSDSTAARFRYVRPSNDSTRVVVEIWSTCRPRGACTRALIALIFRGLTAEEGPPS